MQQSNPSIQDTMPAVTSTEANALRYAAGFVCRHLRNKLEKRNHPLKEELILCILQLIRGADANEESGTAEEWSELIDRGGLWNVRNTTFQVFCALEEEIRPSLRAFVLDSTHTDKAKAITTLISSNDVQFYWCIAAADFDIEDEETHAQLLQKIVELFVTVRGFAYASAWVEKYKQSKDKSTQRSKSLRKKLYTDKNQ